jgi:hypothetical protein
MMDTVGISNAYASYKISQMFLKVSIFVLSVLASYGNDGSRQILDDFREAYYWLWQVIPFSTTYKPNATLCFYFRFVAPQADYLKKYLIPLF